MGRWKLAYLPGYARSEPGAAFTFSSSNAASLNSLYLRPVALQATENVTFKFWARVSEANKAAHSLRPFVAADNTTGSGLLLGSDDISVSGITYQQYTVTFTAATDGIYYFGFLDRTPQVASGQTSAIIVDDIQLTSQLKVNDYLTSQFSVYPNPVKDVLIVQTQSPSKCKGWVEIRSVYNGPIRRFALDISPGKMEHSLSLGFLPTGVYMLRVFTENGNSAGTTRLVKL
jgi:hypothetical protein